jgi:hypothetical protein
MKICTKCKCEKTFCNFSKNSKTKDGFQHHCKSCKLEYQRANPNRKFVTKKYYEANKDLCIARSVISQQKKPNYYSEKMRKWVAENRERHLETRREWSKKNVASESERKQRHRKRIQGSPLLTVAERAEIDGVYMFCKIFATFEVDHIVPLHGEFVSGLHVPWNLQALTISENRSKGNKFKDNHG